MGISTTNLLNWFSNRRISGNAINSTTAGVASSAGTQTKKAEARKPERSEAFRILNL